MFWKKTKILKKKHAKLKKCYIRQSLSPLAFVAQDVKMADQPYPWRMAARERWEARVEASRAAEAAEYERPKIKVLPKTSAAPKPVLLPKCKMEASE